MGEGGVGDFLFVVIKLRGIFGREGGTGGLLEWDLRWVWGVVRFNNVGRTGISRIVLCMWTGGIVLVNWS